MIIKCYACAENQGELDVTIMGVVQKRYACAAILCIRTGRGAIVVVSGRFPAGFRPDLGVRGCLLIRTRDRVG